MATWGARDVTKRTRIIAKVVTAVTIPILALGIAPIVAEAQARGTMQVSARVVVMDDAVRALDAARAALSNLAGQPAPRRPETAPTVARVSVARDPRSIVVTIDYSRS
jgi:hypothetical protein